MNYCNALGCGKSEWAHMNMANSGIGQVRRCTQNLLRIFLSIIEVDIPIERGMAFLSDVISVAALEDILKGVRKGNANSSREDSKGREKLKGLASLIYEFDNKD